MKKTACLIAAYIVIASCAHDEFLYENAGSVESVWFPSEDKDCFVALSGTGLGSFRLIMRRISDGEILWQSPDWIGWGLSGSLYNAVTAQNGFWVSGYHGVAFMELDGHNLKRGPGYPASLPPDIGDRLGTQACELVSGTFLSVTDEAFPRLVYSRGSRWQVVDARGPNWRPLCISEGVFLVVGSAGKELLLGSFQKGAFLFATMLTSKETIHGYHYSKEYGLLMIESLKGVQLYSVDLLNDEVPIFKLQLDSGDEIIHSAEFVPSLPFVITTEYNKEYINLWDFKGNLQNTYHLPKATFAGRMKGVVFSPDGRYMAILSTHGYLIKRTDEAFPVLRNRQ